MRKLKPSQLLDWANDPKSVIRLRTAYDALPNSYTAAWLPVLVDWRNSKLEGATPFVILRNVNHGGNPLERTTVFQSVRIPLDAVEFAEFTLVPQFRNRPNTNFQHGHLRFVFHPDRRPILLSQEGASNGSDPYLDDLVLSWEPWRGIDVKFGFLSAMDGRYDLSMRGYGGAQRYLDDAIYGLPWISYRLRMPGGEEGLRELLMVSLAIGDGAARHSISQMIDENEESWLATLSADENDLKTAKAQWRELQARVKDSGAPAETGRSLDEEERSYNTLVRSCASLARYSVLTTVQRLVSRGLDDGVNKQKLAPAELRDSEPWMQEFASADILKMFIKAPAAIRFLLGNPSSRPKTIPHELDTAGLIVRRDGEPWRVRYDKDHIRPYGPQGVNRDAY